jgi:multidrug efflux pump subunit AcrA (membrane-fusion protein)
MSAPTAPASTVPRASSDPGDEVAARLPVTERSTWLLLTAVAALVAAGLLWTVFGSAPETVRGRGMIVPQGGFVDVGTAVAGAVSQVTVSPGDRVRAGEVVASLTDPDGAPVQIRAQVDGTVATVVVRTGGTTEPGTPLLTIDPDRVDKVAIGFLPAEQGSRVRVGMSALVAVASLPQSEYGFILGRVASIARLPVTSDRVRLLVGGNDELPTYFTATGPVIEVTVTLEENPDNPSGYAWTTGRGPDAEITTGTLAEVSVVLAEATPLQRIAG